MAAFKQKHFALHAKVVAMEHRQLTIEKSLVIKDDALSEHVTLEMTS